MAVAAKDGRVIAYAKANDWQGHHGSGGTAALPCGGRAVQMMAGIDHAAWAVARRRAPRRSKLLGGQVQGLFKPAAE